MSEWQCFDKTLKIYLELSSNQTTFHVITHQVDIALKRVPQIAPHRDDIKVYQIKERATLAQILSEFQYGFLIRKTHPVNYVSSPIKFLEYISCGVNVIMTDAVPSYARIIKTYRIGTILEGHNSDWRLEPFNPNARNVYDHLFDISKYSKLYNDFFNNIV